MSSSQGKNCRAVAGIELGSSLSIAYCADLIASTIENFLLPHNLYDYMHFSNAKEIGHHLLFCCLSGGFNFIDLGVCQHNR